MQLISTYQAGNRIARIYYASISGYTVEYSMNDQVVKKTYHQDQDLAECIAEDFINESGSDPQFLSEHN